MASKEKTQALAYLRTSSAANVGTDRDGDKRQSRSVGLAILARREARAIGAR